MFGENSQSIRNEKVALDYKGDLLSCYVSSLPGRQCTTREKAMESKRFQF